MDSAFLAMNMHCHGVSCAMRSSLGISPGFLGWNCTFLPVLSAGVSLAGILAREGIWSKWSVWLCCCAFAACLWHDFLWHCLCAGPWGWNVGGIFLSTSRTRLVVRFVVLLLPSAQLSQILVKTCMQIAQICHLSPLPKLIKAIPLIKLGICP